MDAEQAQYDRAIGETLDMVKGTTLGEVIFKKLDEIEKQAKDKVFGANLPDSQATLYECRGRVDSVKMLRVMFEEIEDKKQNAINWQVANNPMPTSQSETSASEV